MTEPENFMPSGLYNMDCMEALRTCPDNFFDLAIVDPPYGGGAREGETDDWMKRARGRFGGWFDRYHIAATRTGGQWAEKYKGEGDSDIRHWDVAPPPEYFSELARVSRNQIIWGGNYFDLPPTRCFVVWDKVNIADNFSMAMCEYAWTSFNDNAKLYRCTPQGHGAEPRIHPTQKPVKLYSWLLGLYAKPGMRILDTHAGSAALEVACHRAGLECWGYEVDVVYYEADRARLAREQAQVTIYEQRRIE